MSELIEVNQAVGIKIGCRWFYKFGKKGQVMTAWSLAGAKLFSHGNTKAIEEKLNKKNKCFEIVNVRVIG